MNEIHDLDDLLAKSLKSIYAAENQQLDSLAILANKAIHPELKSLLNEHGREKTEHIRRLRKALDILGIEPEKDAENEVMEELIEQARDTVNQSIKQSINSVSDAGLIASLQQIKHFGIANYGTAASHARVLGHDAIANLLRQNLEEEKHFDKHLTYIAEAKINPGMKKMKAPLTAPTPSGTRSIAKP